MRIKVIRGFFVNPETIATAGSEIDVSDFFGRSMVAVGKAEIVSGDASPRGPMNVENSGALIGNPKGGARDARKSTAE